MAKRDDPEISTFDGSRKTNYIKISFIPDYKRFHSDNLS